MGCGIRHLTGFSGGDCLKRSIIADQVERYKSHRHDPLLRGPGALDVSEGPVRPLAAFGDGILEAPAILIRDITERRERYCTDGTSACQ